MQAIILRSFARQFAADLKQTRRGGPEEEAAMWLEQFFPPDPEGVDLYSAAMRSQPPG